MTTITQSAGYSLASHVASVDVGTSQNLTFSNMTIGGGSVGTGSAPALPSICRASRSPAPLCIKHATNINQDTARDSSSFINVGQSCTEGRLALLETRQPHRDQWRFVISNTLFSRSGPSDGIQIKRRAYGTIIGPGIRLREFWKQAAHAM